MNRLALAAGVLALGACGRFDFAPRGQDGGAGGDDAGDGGDAGSGSTITLVGLSGNSPTPAATALIDCASDAQVGDVLLLVMYLNQDGALPSPPGGSAWQSMFGGDDPTSMFRIALFYENVETAGPEADAFSTPTTDLVQWGCFWLRGVTAIDAQTMPSFISGSIGTSSVTYDLGALTSVDPTDTLVMVLASDPGIGSMTHTWSSAGMRSWFDFANVGGFLEPDLGASSTGDRSATIVLDAAPPAPARGAGWLVALH